MADPRKSELTEAELDRLFDASNAEAPLPSGDLMARILADADALQAGALAPLPAEAGRGLMASLKETLGGWAGLSGLGAAVATGLVIGIFPPEQLATYAETITGGAAYFSDYVPGDAGLGAVTFDG